MSGLIHYALAAAPVGAPAYAFGQSVPHGSAGLVFGIAGLLQLCVAGYAMRLNRRFGTGRVGWSLFWAFLLLAILHLVQAMSQPRLAAGLRIDFEFVYALVSLLLLTGLAHVHAVLREQQHVLQEQERSKQMEQRMRDELELEVQRKTAHLNQAVETLRQEIQVREKAEAQIREQARLLDLAHDAISVQDLEGRILYWNKGAEEIFGWTAQEAAGREIFTLLSVPAQVYAEARALVMKKGRWENESSAVSKDGRKVLVEQDWAVVFDPVGNPKAVLIICADITEKRRLETQALRLQRLESIGTLASGIAHDLNNVLTPLLLSVQVLRDKINTEDERQLLATLQSNVLRGARLVKQILTFGRGVKGERAVVNPVKVLQEIKQLVVDTFPKSLKFETRVDAGLWTVIGDTTQLHQVLLNLCVNARDAMPHGGRLSIEVENVTLDQAYTATNLEAKPGPYVLIKVTDNGSGIPKAIQSKIFEPFFSTKDLGKGTGLGLSTCFNIVKSHGGFINCYSEPGSGTAFKVYLPANTSLAAAEPGAPAPASPPSGHGEVVLVVDDEQVIREFAQITLECFGYRVLTAADGAEAVSVYKSHQAEISTVVMDMWMPVMDGPAAVAALKSINSQVRIIGTSGLACLGGEKTEAKLVAFLPKPYTAESLLHAIDKVLRPAAGWAVKLPANKSAETAVSSCLAV
jgi:PAS domain S-box-containing protein